MEDLRTASSVAEKANLRVSIPSTLKTNTICPLSSSLILLVSGLPLFFILLDKGLFKLGGHDAPPASRLNTQMSRFPIC